MIEIKFADFNGKFPKFDFVYRLKMPPGTESISLVETQSVDEYGKTVLEVRYADKKPVILGRESYPYMLSLCGNVSLFQYYNAELKHTQERSLSRLIKMGAFIR